MKYVILNKHTLLNEPYILTFDTHHVYSFYIDNDEIELSTHAYLNKSIIGHSGTIKLNRGIEITRSEYTLPLFIEYPSIVSVEEIIKETASIKMMTKSIIDCKIDKININQSLSLTNHDKFNQSLIEPIINVPKMNNINVTTEVEHTIPIDTIKINDYICKINKLNKSFNLINQRIRELNDITNLKRTNPNTLNVLNDYSFDIEPNIIKKNNETIVKRIQEFNQSIDNIDYINALVSNNIS